MLKMLVRDMEGMTLDYFVARAEGRGVRGWPNRLIVSTPGGFDTCEEGYSPSSLWFYGGPIIERERIAVVPFLRKADGAIVWRADVCPDGKIESVEFGYWEVPAGEHPAPTALIAAMRSYVTHKLGDEVELP